MITSPSNLANQREKPEAWQRSSRQLDDALIVEPREAKRHWSMRYTLNAAILALLIFPFFFGGRHDYACGLLQLLIFGFGLAISLNYIFRGKHLAQKLELRLAYQSIFLAIIIFCGLLLLQTTALNLSLLSWLSPGSAELYRLSGAQKGYISLEPSTTLSQLNWLIALALCGFWFVSLPQEAAYSFISSSSRGMRRKAPRAGDSVLERARATDYVASLFQSAIIWLGVLCSAVAIVHWALRCELLFGLFDPGRGGSEIRAHWPFVNPDHLSVLLEISIIVTYSRLLRLSQLKQLRGHCSKPDNLALRILQSPGNLGRQLPYALALLTMILCNVLTLSRGGNVLVLLGLAFLYLMYQRLSLKPANSYHLRQRDEGKIYNSVIAQHWLRLGSKAASVIALLLIVLFFLGQTGRDLAANRIEYGLAAGYDESRQALNAASMRVFADYPIFGMGLGNWHLAAARYLPRELAGWTISVAHNDYLQLLGETGLVGAFLFLFCLLVIFTRTRLAWRQELMPTQRIEILGSVTALCLPMFHAFFDFPFHLPALAFVFLLALVVHLRLVQRVLSV